MQKEEQNVLQARFTVWLKKLILRAKIDYLRRLTKTNEALLKENEEVRLEADFSFDIFKDRFEFEDRKIDIALSKLSISKRELLVKIYIMNMTAEEIAKESNVSVQHVYNQHSLAITKIVRGANKRFILWIVEIRCFAGIMLFTDTHFKGQILCLYPKVYVKTVYCRYAHLPDLINLYRFLLLFILFKFMSI